MAAGGANLLVDGGGPRLHFWRAPHRNDDDWADANWRRYGLRTLAWRTLSSRAVRLTPASVRIELSTFGEGKRGWGVNHAAVWTVYGDGTILADHAVSPQGRRVALARVGIRVILDKKLNRVEYFGRGPMENYSDRKSAATTRTSGGWH
jgi:beta-galactosidase